MKSFFKKFKPQVLKTKEELVLEKLSKHPICKSMCKLEFKDMESGARRAWMNPHNQTSFVCHWYSVEDFEDWMNGRGNIVKGKDDEEKAMFWKYVQFEINTKFGWEILHNFKYFDLFPNPESNFKWAQPNENPFKITKSNHNEIAAKMFSEVIDYWVEDFEDAIKYDNTHWTTDKNHFNRVREKFLNYSQGVCKTLYYMGIGHYGYCNTPNKLDNLSWIKDVAIAKCHYLALISLGADLPDFERLNKFIYKY